MPGRSGGLRHLAVLWALALSFDAYVLFDLWTGRIEAERRALQLATSYVRLVEEQASGSFNRTNLLLRQAAGLVAESDLALAVALPGGRRHAIEAGLRDLQREGHGIVSISMTDGEGRVFANSLGAPTGGSLANRDYFQALKEGDASRPVVSRLIKGRVSNKWGIQVARAMRGADGRFRGMVVANMGLSEYFQPFYQSLLLPPGAVIALRDLGHRLVVRFPAADYPDGQPVSAEPVDRVFAEGLSEGSYHGISPIDGVARVVAFRRLAGHPLYAVAALADDDTLASWRQGVTRGLLFAALTTLGAALATVVLMRQQRLEQEVRSNAEKLALALKAANAGTWYADAGAGRLEWSAELQDLYGCPPPGDPPGWLALLHPDDRARAAAEVDDVLRRCDGAYRSEFRILGPDGRERWLAAIGAVYYDRAGEPSRAFGVNIDITAAKLAEAQLEAARDEALEAKAEADRASLARSKFLAAASHDLRQPVQSLLLLIEVMKIRLSGTPMERVTSQMEQALDALRLLLNSLLDISKLDAGVIVPSVEPVDLGRLLERLADEYRVRAAAKGLEFRAVSTSLRLDTDPALLERLVRNLIENAVRYTASGRILVGCRRTRDRVRIEVVDTGIGIAPEHHDAVFEEFHQVGNTARDRSQGLGLGLAIVRRLVGLLGGHVELRSRLGRGARFALVLPRS